MDVAIYSELIAGIFGLLTALVAVWGAKQKIGLAQAEGELDTKRKCLALKVDAEKWHKVSEKIKELVRSDESPIDRVLQLRCWNGWRDPHYATAVFQWRADGQVPEDYISVPLDADYVERMADMQNSPPHVIDVEAQKNILPWNLITRLYISEDVKHSLWFPVAKSEHKIPGFFGIFRWFGFKVRAVTFVSFATHSDDPIPPECYGTLELITHMIRDAMID